VKFPTWRRRRPYRPRPLRKIALLPTLITLGNAVCGVLAVMACLQKEYGLSALYVFAGMVFDALDGKVARATGTTSQFGAQLDSLCDVLTFGLAPAVLVWSLTVDPALQLGLLPPRLVTAACVFYCLAAVIRLARFNIETDADLKSHLEFTGLPSPAAAGVVAATVALVLWDDERTVPAWILKPLPVAAFLIGVLMISRVRYPHVLNKFLGGFSPAVQLVEILVALLVGVAFKQYALFVLFAGYALFGPIAWVGRRLMRPAAAPAAAAEPPATAPPPAPPKDEEPLF
jgi:CDP-diacylglycerol--serine O-phosphatidyltransferase